MSSPCPARVSQGKYLPWWWVRRVLSQWWSGEAGIGVFPEVEEFLVVLDGFGCVGLTAHIEA